MPFSATKFDPSYATATEVAQAIRQRVISSRELTALVFSRIRKFNPKVNAFVTLLEESANVRARQADEAQAAGTVWGPLHGVPITVKDYLDVSGVRTTFGVKAFENNIAAADAITVERLKRAGAVIIAKTNMPPLALDWQSFNDIAGTTNNPWDLSRTCGGSSGGGAAAVAAGMSFLELGGDTGGSIRCPSSFCGDYGHRASINLIPGRANNISTYGPLARSAQDLLLALGILAGPDATESVAYRWALPAARGTRLRDYRIGFVIDDPFCPVTPEVAAVLRSSIEALRKSGATLTEGWPAGVVPANTFGDYFFLISAAVAAFLLPGLEQSLRSSSSIWNKRMVAAMDASYSEWCRHNSARLASRGVWQDYFKTHDAFLMPVTFVPAFPHDHVGNQHDRTLHTSLGDRPYADLHHWASISSLTGLPATAVPLGITRDGLPVGAQILGPFLEDATPIHIAGLLGDHVGGFQIPPGYAE